VFKVLKRVAWFRIVRVRRGCEGVRLWRRRTVDAVAGRVFEGKGRENYESKRLTEAVRAWKANAPGVKRDNEVLKRSLAHRNAFALKKCLNRLLVNSVVKGRYSKAGGLLKRVYCVGVLLRSCFDNFKGYCECLDVKHGGILRIAVARLCDNVRERYRVKEGYRNWEVYYDKKCCGRMFGYFRRYWERRKGFRKRVLRALEGNMFYVMRYYFGRFRDFYCYRRGFREEQIRVSVLHYRRRIVWKCYARIKALLLDKYKLMESQACFVVYKKKKYFKKLHDYHLKLESVRAFRKVKERESRFRVLRHCMVSFNKIVSERRKCDGVCKIVKNAVVGRAWNRFVCVYKAFEYCSRKRVEWRKNVVKSWQEQTEREKQRRCNLLDLTRKYVIHRVIRVAKIHAMAVNYFGNRCGWSFMLMCFRCMKKYCNRFQRGKKIVKRVWHNKVLGEKKRGFRMWKECTERLNWHSATMRIIRVSYLRRLFYSWHAFAKNEKSDRLLCESGDAGYVRLRKHNVLAKFMMNVHRNKRYMDVMKRGREHYELMWKVKCLHVLQERCEDKMHCKQLGRRSDAFWRRRKIRWAMISWKGNNHKTKITKVQRLAAMLMCNKKTLVNVFYEWKKMMKKCVVLRASVVSGLILMKVLAWKRWKSGVLHSKMRIRYMRSIFRRWCLFVDFHLFKLKKGIKKRFFRNFVMKCTFIQKRRLRTENSYKLVKQIRLNQLWKQWNLTYKAHEFYLTRSTKWRKERALYILRKRSKLFGTRRRILARWMTANEDRVTSVAQIIWRIGMSSFILMRVPRTLMKENDDGDCVVPSWIGSITHQRLYIAFEGLKGWLAITLEQGRANSKALNFWRLKLLAKAHRNWRLVRNERLLEEDMNEVALDFWYDGTLRKVFAHWIVRTAYFKEMRRECEWNLQRAGFERFVGGVLRERMRKRQVQAADALGEARRKRLRAAVIQAWSDVVIFEKKDRALRKARQATMNLMKETFVTWHMIVKGMIMTRLVHTHQDASLAA
jgi:hypothetical protein